MPFDTNSFDLCFGISVLTHLNESNQFTWLQELSRLVKTDGLALLSVLGVQTLSRAPQLLEQMTDGFVFVEDDHEIGRLVGEPSYYGTAYHSEDYVRRRWSEWFRVVDYVPAALGHQDIVVLQAW